MQMRRDIEMGRTIKMGGYSDREGDGEGDGKLHIVK